MKYKFTLKPQPPRPKKKKEVISLIDANSKSEAEEKFAAIKNLPLEIFLELFEVKENE